MAYPENTAGDIDELETFEDGTSNPDTENTIIFVMFLLPFMIDKREGKFHFSKSKVRYY
jgi:hypothetical protein